MRKLALAGADGAEGDAHVPEVIRPSSEQLLDHLRAGIGGEVEVVAQAAEQRVADRATDQGELVSGCSEALAELVSDRCHAQQLLHGEPLGVVEGTADRRRGARLT